MRARSTTRAGSDAGYTLVELLVSMIVLGIFFSVFTGVVVRVFRSTTDQQGRSQDIDAARQVGLVLDRQVRYANGINGSTVAADGTEHVEWQVGGRGARQTCYQWEVLTTGGMRYRSWQVPFAAGDPSAASTATAWRTAATGVDGIGTAGVFSLTGPVALSGAVVHQQLTVGFTVTSGGVTTPTHLTLTALNTATSSPPSPAVCQEVSFP